jgi:hypothetical protein
VTDTISSMTQHHLALRIERVTGFRVITACYDDLNPETIEPFLKTQVVSCNLDRVLSGKQKPKNNMLLLTYKARTPDSPQNILLYEFTQDAAVRINRLFQGSDEFGYHLN